MLRNESVKVYELLTGFTLEATVSSSDSEITVHRNNSVVTSASISVSAIVYYRFQAINRGYCRHDVISCLQAVLCVDLRAEIICPDLNKSLF